MNIQLLFENELSRLGIPFSVDAESGRHAIELAESRILVSLDNLRREMEADRDVGRIQRFVKSVIGSADGSRLSADQLFWNLEPNEYEVCPEYRVAMSEHVDRVLVHLSPDETHITWVTPEMLKSLGLPEVEAGARAFQNLAHALSAASVEHSEIDGVRLGFVGTTVPFKASLMLAPNLREIMEPVIGWPLLAVAPDRGFLYVWDAQHAGFAQRVGGVVVREYSKAAYPISTEVYEISGEGIRAIGAFAKPD